MITFFLACVFSVLFANAAFAEPQADKEAKRDARHAKMIERVVKKLELDDGRAYEVTTILKESHTARKALAKKRGEEAKALKQATTEKLSAVLTPEELETFKKIKKKAAKKMKRKMKEHKKEKKKERKNKSKTEETGL